ncbi:DUF4133 domain-containing protein [Hymenobacter sp. UV11]|uniref:DUF4133 domain-containing protein n=1 Tax=Hymenobacter sp. UV11 TaxID=1849735 RepID=UPI00105FB3A4|nr:DUF4133 domain-containing protein [Hymenobacter sp. UV11]TDN39865.1 hypothetical protein A8B98_16875 [Hymenobacter sp. UV11]TFZ63212.1 DUF4133 domain-containing protein [Hymenobacter sp. UV11]
MPGYNLNRGINKSWEFQGLVGGNVYYLVAGIGLVFVSFVTMYLVGVPLLISVIVTLALGGGMWAGVFALNTKYGEHGLMKASARRSAPKLITNRQSRLFQNLNEDQTGR